MKFRTPKGWRKGQTLFNFLEWVQQKGEYKTLEQIDGVDQVGRMADPFYWDDETFDRLWREYQYYLDPDNDGELSIFAN